MNVWQIRAAAVAAAIMTAAAAATGSWWAALGGVAACLLVVALVSPALRRETPSRPVVRTPAGADAAVVVEALFASAAARTDALAAHLWLEDEPTATLRLVAASGPRLPAPSPVATDDPTMGAALADGQARFAAIARVREGGADTTIWRFAVPVGADEARGIAAVDVACADCEPEATALTEITSALRGALTAALALHVARGETQTARLLVDAAQELSSRLCPEDVLRSTLDRAMQMSHAATGSIMLRRDEGGAMTIVESRGLSHEVVSETVVRDGEGIAGWVLASGSSMLVEDMPGRPASGRHGVRSAVCVPIGDEHGTLGVLNVGSRAFPARFTDEHRRALEALGSQAAIALRNARAMERSQDLYLSSLQALAVALETKDPYSIGAAGRVADLALALGRQMHLDPEDLQSVHVAAILHDIGMGMAAGPVGASGRPLTTVDRGLLRAHPRVAADVLTRLPALEAVVPIVFHHHEHFDGHGYDGGLAGEAIPVGSRILAVADAYVSMTAQRPYRRALTAREALDELNAKSGSQFDPEVVEAFRRLLRENPDLAFTDR
ncbi:MAG: GAF domain-containing protein [Coriobacteriia bacterium]|nr:GAF domain-containing protein [Coriobacteriia bacterium]